MVALARLQRAPPTCARASGRRGRRDRRSRTAPPGTRVPGLDAVVRRVGVERLELLGVVGRAVLRRSRSCPSRTGGSGACRAAAPRRPRRANSSGRCVIAAPTSRPPFEPPRIARLLRRACSLSLDQVLGRGDEVVEHVLLARAACRRRCQSSPYSPPPRRFGDRVDAAALEPRTHATTRTPGVMLDVEAAVAVEERRVRCRRAATSFLCTRNIETFVPSFDG